MAEPEAILGPAIENDLVKRCQAGDRQAFEELFYHYRDDVFRFAYLVIRDVNLAQDAVQEAFLKVFRSIGKFQHRSSFKSWLYRVAVNESISILRRRKAKEELEPTPDVSVTQGVSLRAREWQPEDAVLDGEERDALRLAIDQLDPGYRSVVVLKYFHEFSDVEIAEIIGCPTGTVKSRLHRARELLRNAMSRQMGRPDLIALSYARLSTHVV